MNRREFWVGVSVAATVGLAGCSAFSNGDDANNGTDNGRNAESEAIENEIREYLDENFELIEEVVAAGEIVGIEESIGQIEQNIAEAESLLSDIEDHDELTADVQRIVDLQELIIGDFELSMSVNQEYVDGLSLLGSGLFRFADGELTLSALQPILDDGLDDIRQVFDLFEEKKSKIQQIRDEHEAVLSLERNFGVSDDRSEYLYQTAEDLEETEEYIEYIISYIQSIITLGNFESAYNEANFDAAREFLDESQSLFDEAVSEHDVEAPSRVLGIEVQPLENEEMSAKFTESLSYFEQAIELKEAMETNEADLAYEQGIESLRSQLSVESS